MAATLAYWHGCREVHRSAGTDQRERGRYSPAVVPRGSRHHTTREGLARKGQDPIESAPRSLNGPDRWSCSHLSQTRAPVASPSIGPFLDPGSRGCAGQSERRPARYRPAMGTGSWISSMSRKTHVRRAVSTRAADPKQSPPSDRCHDLSPHRSPPRAGRSSPHSPLPPLRGWRCYRQMPTWRKPNVSACIALYPRAPGAAQFQILCRDTGSGIGRFSRLRNIWLDRLYPGRPGEARSFIGCK